MKKVILLVASLLSAIQIFASKSKLLTVDNALTLSPSHEIYNHGSHASHCSHSSHASHYSSSITQTNSSSNSSLQRYTTSIIKESLDSLPVEVITKVKKRIALEWNVSLRDISLKEACYAYVSLIQTIDSTSMIVAKKEYPSKTKCVYLEFDNGNWYIIPISQNYNTIVRGTSSAFVEVTKSEWMKNLK